MLHNYVTCPVCKSLPPPNFEVCPICDQLVEAEEISHVYWVLPPCGLRQLRLFDTNLLKVESHRLLGKS